MAKEELIEIIQGILNTDIDLSFLLKLEKSELEKLVATIRDRVEQAGERPFLLFTKLRYP